MVAAGIVCGLWLLSALSELFNAATVENQEMCAWLKDPAKPNFARLGPSTHQALFDIRKLKSVDITCTIKDHRFNESPIETSLIVNVNGEAKMGLRYGRALHFMSPFIPNSYLGFWTY